MSDEYTQRIEGQYRLAMNSFPNLKRLSVTEFSISFAAPQTYNISLPREYPEQAPKITLDGKETAFPIITSWIPAFQLFQVLDHLKVASNVKPLQPFNISQGEIETAISSTSPERLQNYDDKLHLIETCPTIKAAKEASEKAKKEITECNNQTDQLISSTIEKADQLRDMLAKHKDLKKKVAAIPPRPADMSAESKANKIKQLQEENRKAEADVADKLAQFQAGTLPFDKYLKEAKAIKETMIKNQLIAQQLS